MRRIRQSSNILLPLLAAIALAGCSHKVDRDQARSEIKSAVSLVAESALFVDYIRQGRSTRQYADGHTAYLQDEVRQSLDKLQQAKPEPGTATAIHECRAQLESLQRELSGIPAAFGHVEALSAAKGRIEDVRLQLEKAGSSL